MAAKKKTKRRKKAILKSKTKKRKALKKKPSKKRSITKTKKRKPAKKKPTARRTAPKKTKATARRKKPAASTGAPRAPQPLTTRTPIPTPAPAPQTVPGEERIGIVTHFYSHLSVAVIQLESGQLRVGDTIHIKGHTSDFYQSVGSMEIEHVHVSEARAGQVFGLRVSEHAREHDIVYKAVTP